MFRLCWPACMLVDWPGCSAGKLARVSKLAVRLRSANRWRQTVGKLDSIPICCNPFGWRRRRRQRLRNHISSSKRGSEKVGWLADFCLLDGYNGTKMCRSLPVTSRDCAERVERPANRVRETSESRPWRQTQAEIGSQQWSAKSTTSQSIVVVSLLQLLLALLLCL